MYVCKYNCNYMVHVYLFVKGNIPPQFNFVVEGDGRKFFHDENFSSSAKLNLYFNMSVEDRISVLCVQMSNECSVHAFYEDCFSPLYPNFRGQGTRMF